MKHLLISTLLLGSHLQAADVPAKAEKPVARPNIIFLLTDDQHDNTLGAMGHPFVKTPHLDALMQDSVRFKNAYIATPVCSPSRVSFFTGMPERVHGVGFSSSYDLTEQQWERTYPALLRKGGYFTGFVGKFGVEYYTFKGMAAEKFDFWWGHDGWKRSTPLMHRNPMSSSAPPHPGPFKSNFLAGQFPSR
jgi:arylsulfatase A-like enzyme